MRHAYCVIDTELPAAQHRQVFRYDDADGIVQRTCRNPGSCMSHLSLIKQMTVLVKVLPWEVGMGRQLVVTWMS